MSAGGPGSVTALVPTYDRPAELAVALRSVLDQDWPGSLEVLVGDDGGKAGPVVEALGDDRVRLVLHPRRLGMAGNWNALLDLAGGDYVTLLNDDDRWLPGFLRATAGRLDAAPDVDVAFTNHVFDRDGEVTVRDCPLPPGRHADFAADYLRLLPVSIAAAVFRRDWWPRVRPLPDTEAADVVLYGRMAGLGAVFWYDDRPLMSYTLHQAQFSRSAAFRERGVLAWESMAFADPEAERRRRARLRAALAARAAARVRTGNLAGARADLAAAAATGGAPAPHERLLRTLTTTGPLARPALRAYDALRRP